MKKVLLKVMTKSGHIQEGIVEIVPRSCNSNWLHCNCDEGVDRNCDVLDSEYEIYTRDIEMIKPYLVDTEEVPTISIDIIDQIIDEADDLYHFLLTEDLS